MPFLLANQQRQSTEGITDKTAVLVLIAGDGWVAEASESGQERRRRPAESSQRLQPAKVPTRRLRSLPSNYITTAPVMASLQQQ